MDTTIPMQPSGGFVEGFRALITPDVVSKASTAFGESESAVTKGMGAALPALFGVLASKASDRSFMSRIIDMVRDPVAESSAAGNVSQILNTGESTETGMSLGTRFMSALLRYRPSAVQCQRCSRWIWGSAPGFCFSAPTTSSTGWWRPDLHSALFCQGNRVRAERRG